MAVDPTSLTLAIGGVVITVAALWQGLDQGKTLRTSSKENASLVRAAQDGLIRTSEALNGLRDTLSNDLAILKEKQEEASRILHRLDFRSERLDQTLL